VTTIPYGAIILAARWLKYIGVWCGQGGLGNVDLLIIKLELLLLALSQQEGQSLPTSSGFQSCISAFQSTLQDPADKSKESCVFWATLPGSPLNVNRRFWRTCCFHVHSRKVNQARNSMKQVASREDTFIPNVNCLSTDYKILIQWDTTLLNHDCEDLRS
jgi:hypothetical protein